jgi:hypothetical protein
MKTKSLQFGVLTDLAAEILNQVTDPTTAAPDLITFLCRWFDCQWGTCWHVDAKKLLLTPACCWNNESLRVEKLRRHTDGRRLALGEGTAGLVWRTGVPVCTSDLVRDMCLPRSLDAGAAGLRGGIWFPICSEITTYAVVELLGQHYWVCDERFIGELKTLGLELGRGWARKSGR